MNGQTELRWLRHATAVAAVACKKFKDFKTPQEPRSIAVQLLNLLFTEFSIYMIIKP